MLAAGGQKERIVSMSLYKQIISIGIGEKEIIKKSKSYPKR